MNCKLYNFEQQNSIVTPSRFLNDLWLLNAVTSLGAQNIRQIFLQQFDQYSHRGLYVLCLNLPVRGCCYIIIDDRIPCYAQQNGQDIPLFSHCSNKSTFWVELIQKAFAKLFWCYFALHQSGRVQEALHILTGNVIEAVPLDQENIQLDKIANLLSVLTQTNSIALVASDRDMIISKNQEKILLCQSQALSHGVMSGSYYKVKQLINPVNECGRSEQLVKLQLNWAQQLEYTGDFSVNDTDFWKDNEKRLEIQKKGQHIMHIHHFVNYFNILLISRSIPYNYQGVLYKRQNFGQGSYGFPHASKNPDWIKNPQFIFRISNLKSVPNRGSFTLKVILSQQDRRIQNRSIISNEKQLIAFVVLKMGMIQQQVTYFDPSKHVYISRLTNQSHVQASINLGENGKYCIIPLTKSRGVNFAFSLCLLYKSQQATNIEQITSERYVKIRSNIKDHPKISLDLQDVQKNFINQSNLQSKWIDSLLTDHYNLEQILYAKGGISSSGGGGGGGGVGGGLDRWNISKLRKVSTGYSWKTNSLQQKRKTISSAQDKGQNFKIKSQVTFQSYDIPRIDYFRPDMEFQQLTKLLLGVQDEIKNNADDDDQNQQMRNQGVMDFDGFYLGDEGLQHILDYIIEDKHVNTLLLRNNNLKDNGVIQLCKALQQSHKTSIIYIDLRCNCFTAKGAVALLAMKQKIGSKTMEIDFDSS